MLRVTKLLDGINKNGNAYILNDRSISGREVVSIEVDENGEFDLIHFISSKKNFEVSRDEKVFDLKTPLEKYCILSKYHVGELDKEAIRELASVISYTLYDGTSVGTCVKKPDACTDYATFAIYDVASKINNGASNSHLANIIMNHKPDTFKEVALNDEVNPTQISSIEQAVPSIEIQFTDFFNRICAISSLWKELNSSINAYDYMKNASKWEAILADKKVDDSSKILKKYNKSRLNGTLKL